MPEALSGRARAGARAWASLGRQSVVGVIVRVHDDKPPAGTALKAVAAIPDAEPLLPPSILAFTEKLSVYQASSWGQLLGLALPPDPVPARKRRPPEGGETAAGQLELGLETTAAVAAAASEIGRRRGGDFPDALLAWGGEGACRSLIAEASREVLERGENVLVLLPDVARTEDLRARIRLRLGTMPALLHGKQSPRVQAGEWEKVGRGEARIVLGSRSALFKPWPGIGLVIVEDESDESHFQRESPAYDVRRGALFRAEAEKAAVLYTAALPSVTAFARAKADGALRALGGMEPAAPVRLVEEASGKGPLSRPMREALAENLAAGARSVVFLNRRGYASMLFCPACGFIPRCGRCGSVFSYHKRTDRLSCHTCGADDARPNACPSCGHRVLEPRGGGVEAIEEEILSAFPRARIAVFDRDRAGKAADRENILGAYTAGRIDVLIGTQMLARRIDLPPADFVGVFHPEAGLAFPDFQAAERVFQTLSRMIRFARPDGRGRFGAVVQTGFPEHHSIRTAARADCEGFIAEELDVRRLLLQPPFVASAEVALHGTDARSLGRAARMLAARWKETGPEVRVLGPSFSMEAGRTGAKRVQLELRAGRTASITAVLKDGLKEAGHPWSVVRHDAITS
ncbi:MAG: primosomal protein N' [Candidatus Aminicenantes bacterium]|nr:primosomal protein N' [Candidatus Aminicenantes bacterium]